MVHSTKYANVLVKIGAQRSTLLTEIKLKALTENSSLREFATQLRETVYNEKVSKVTESLNSRKLERLFRENLIEAYIKIVSNAPKMSERFLKQAS